MRVLVTGAAGFLGSNLCERLLKQGHTVVALDNLQTGAKENFSDFATDASFSFVEHDVTKPFPDLGAKFDRIYNLACAASPPRYQADPVHTTLTSVLGVLHGLDLARAHNARFFQASTSEVYGDPDVHPQPESYRGNVNPIGPRACYDEGKRAAESLIFDHQRMHKTEVRVARIFNTYGPRMDPKDGRVVSNFIMQALEGKALTVYGTGQQTRSFCYVDDLLDGFIGLMEHPTESGPVNIGNPVEFTMLELAEEVTKLIGGKANVVHEALPVDDPRQRRPDISKAKAAFGFDPKYPLVDGLRRTIEYFRTRR
ncbi:MAG: SDR family oxidoreductase [Sandaracinaceae bacterium]|nr:SDR family oxidoreductase [Sandaracinaceae bacterium]